VTKPLYKWCAEFNINYQAVLYRISQRWPESRIFEPAKRSRASIIVDYNGETKPLVQLCTELNFHYSTALKKFNLGLPVEQIFKKQEPSGPGEDKYSLENHWCNKLERIKEQQEAEKEIFQALIGKMRRKRYLLFRRYLREAEAESIMRVSA
jgi:hypothetical protein